VTKEIPSNEIHAGTPASYQAQRFAPEITPVSMKEGIS
jgi:hypothetical protein